MKVYVVMGNDYPDSVFASEEKADAYASEAAIKSKEEARQRNPFAPGIHFRVYPFEVQE